MDSLTETFHIDVKILIAQVINFSIIFVVLYFFAFKPLGKIMRDRTRKIEKSIVDAKKIEEKLTRTDEKYDEVLTKAKKEANEIIERGAIEGEKKKKEIIQKSKEEVQQIIQQERVVIKSEKAASLKEIKKEVADLVTASLKKVLKEEMNDEREKELVKKIVDNNKA